MSDGIPSSSFEEHAVAERSIFGLLSHFVVFNFVVDFELEGELVNGDLALSGVVLERAREEGLREEEPGDPEGRWSTLVDPTGQEINTVVKVEDPRGERLQGKESSGGPGSWHLIVVERGSDLVQLLRHDDLTDKRLLYIDQVVLHQVQQSVVADKLLGKHSVHRFVVIGRVFLLRCFDVEWRWGLLLNVLGDFSDYLIAGLATAT